MLRSRDGRRVEDREVNVSMPQWQVTENPTSQMHWQFFQPPLKDFFFHSVFFPPPRRGVTGWCHGCPPSSCCRLPRHSRRFQRKGVSTNRPSPAAWMVRTPTCFRWGQIAGGAPHSLTAGTAEREGGVFIFRFLFFFSGASKRHSDCFLLTRRGLQFSLTYFPAEELSSQSRRPR